MCSHRGTPSPLKDIEDALVEICVDMGRIYHPLTIPETIKLANDLISGTESENALLKMKAKQNKDLPIVDCKKVGRGWWEGFFKRHGEKLVTKRGEKFAHNGADWTKEVYIRQMYDRIYDNLVTAKVAKRLEEPVYYDKIGNVVPEEESYGLECDIEITDQNTSCLPMKQDVTQVKRRMATTVVVNT